MTAAYTSSAEHLRDELARVELLVRAFHARWHGEAKPPHAWGIPLVTTAEVQRFLDVPFDPHADWPPCPAAAPYLQQAGAMGAHIRRRLEATPAASTLSLVHLAESFELDAVAVSILLVCLLPEFDPRYRRLYGYLQDDLSKARPTCELVWSILRPMLGSPESAWRSVAPEAPLFRGRLLHLARETGQPLSRREVVLEDAASAFLFGCPAVDARLEDAARLEPENTPDRELPLEADLIEGLRAFAELSRAGRPAAMLHFEGEAGCGQHEAARAVAAALDRPLLSIDTAAALRLPLGFRESVALVYRDARLHGAVVAWRGMENLWSGDAALLWPIQRDTAAAYPGVTIFHSAGIAAPRVPAGDAEILRFSFRAPSLALRERLWREELQRLVPGGFPASWPSTMASAFRMSQAQIAEAAQNAAGLAVRRDLRTPQLTLGDLQKACRRQSASGIGNLARRVEPREQVSLERIVLPAANKQQLAELRDGIRHRHALTRFGWTRDHAGTGLLALFSGPSGTGKTMSAQLLAQEQGVDLYKVDLASLVSKWVGETPKNLNRVFDEAEGSNAILFFDEADAVFGKRGRVASPQDRWANLEVNHLLQRVETYSGVCILATNLKDNLDDAFLRRIHRMVDFPMPAPAERRRIWSLTLPPMGHLLSEEQIRDLANRFELSGGSIHNAAVDAAYRSLAEDAPGIELRHVVLGIARELQKLGRPVSMANFGDYFAWVDAGILDPEGAHTRETLAEPAWA